MSINGDIKNNTSINNDIEVAKLRRVLTILLSVSRKAISSKTDTTVKLTDSES